AVDANRSSWFWDDPLDSPPTPEPIRRPSMATAIPRALLEVRYEAAAQDYLRSLPLEHFMESIGQSTQRKITLESLDLVSARRPDFHVFSELLVQYERPGERKPGQVCP